jgi:uridine kinase
MNIPQQLIQRVSVLTPPAIVAVSGLGGAGKSTFTSILSRQISAPVVGVDSFIKDRTISDYSHWSMMDFERLEREVLIPFAQGESLRYGHYDWLANAVSQTRIIPHTGHLIVEGVGLFRPALLSHFSLMIWIDCPVEEAIRRGKKRDREVHHNPQDDSWDGIWKRNDEQYCRSYEPKRVAHFTIDNRNPEPNQGVQ